MVTLSAFHSSVCFRNVQGRWINDDDDNQRPVTRRFSFIQLTPRAGVGCRLKMYLAADTNPIQIRHWRKILEYFSYVTGRGIPCTRPYIVMRWISLVKLLSLLRLIFSSLAPKCIACKADCWCTFLTCSRPLWGYVDARPPPEGLWLIVSHRAYFLRSLQGKSRRSDSPSRFHVQW